MEISFQKQTLLHTAELKKFSEQKKQIRRLWNIDPETANFLYDLVLEEKPDRILEIGTSNGYSTFWLSLAAELIFAEIDTIEVDKSRYDLAVINLQQRKNVNLILGLAEEVISLLSGKYDLIFIDAGKIGYIEYLKKLKNKLKPGTLLIADNVISHADTVRDYLDFVHNHNNFKTKTVNIGSGLEISRYR